MSQLQQHPLSAAFPAMSADDFLALVDDIKANGQREPVIVFEGMVLDGWHRYSACIAAEIEPHKFTFDASKDPVAFVLSQNLHRRHLSGSQRAAAVVACSEWAPKGRPGKAEAASGLREKDMAKVAGTSDRTIRDAKVAHKAGLTDAIKDGALTAEEAARVARGTPAPAAKTEAPKSSAPDFGPSAEEIAASERDQQEELESLRKIAAADDKLAAALAECTQLRALNRVLTERNNGLMNEKTELVRRIKSLQRKLEQPA